MFALANPWVILGLVVGLGISHGAVAWKAYDFGADRQKVICQTRVDKIMDNIADQNKKIEALKETWDKALDAVQESYNADRAKDEEEITTLKTKVGNYASTIADNPQCVLDQHDIDSVD